MAKILDTGTVFECSGAYQLKYLYSPKKYIDQTGDKLKGDINNKFYF
jgi:hypothetical protein